MQKRGTKLKHYFLSDINPVIRFLVLSDTIATGAAGLLGPIFALFVEGFIVGGNEAVAGIAAGVFLFARSILQIPIAHVLDKIRGEKDDYWVLIIFSFLSALVPLLYLFISTPLQLYVVQFVLGLLSAFTFPSYMGIFTRHIDNEKEGTEWGIYFTLTDISSALLAIVGGYIASSYGFHTLIIAVVVLTLFGAGMMLPVKPYIRMPRKK